MKKLQFFSMAALLLVGAIACTKDPVPSPLSSVIVQDGNKTVSAAIDHTAKTVKFDKFAELDDFAAVKVSIAVAKGASLVSLRQMQSWTSLSNRSKSLSTMVLMTRPTR